MCYCYYITFRANQETVVSYNSTVPNLPSIDFYLENEIKKASSMLYCFKNTLGEEKIPRELLDIAKGVVFLTIVKAGFMFTGRYGTGLVVAKLAGMYLTSFKAVPSMRYIIIIIFLNKTKR